MDKLHGQAVQNSCKIFSKTLGFFRIPSVNKNGTNPYVSRVSVFLTGLYIILMVEAVGVESNFIAHDTSILLELVRELRAK